MMKNIYLYKEYLIKFLFALLFLLMTFFLTFGVKKNAETLNDLYLVNSRNYLLMIQFIIPVIFIGDFYPIKEELFRMKRPSIVLKAEKVLTVFLIIMCIRFISLEIYNLTIFHSFDCFNVFMRFMFVDVINVFMCAILSNVILNKYCSVIVILVINALLFILKILMYSAIDLQYANIFTISYWYYLLLGVMLVLFILSGKWRREYVRN